MFRNHPAHKPPLGTSLNWGHPLTRGMVGCWHFRHGRAGLANLARTEWNGSVVGSPTFDAYDGGAWKFTETDYIDVGDQIAASPYNFTGSFSALTSFFWPTGIPVGSTIHTAHPMSRINFETAGWNFQTNGLDEPVGGL